TPTDAQPPEQAAAQARDELGLARVLPSDDGRRGGGGKVTCELGERCERLPVGRAVGLGKRLGVGAALDDPLSKLLRADRPVLPAVASDDFEHAWGFL